MKCDKALETLETLGLQTVSILRMAKVTPKHKSMVQHTRYEHPCRGALMLSSSYIRLRELTCRRVRATLYSSLYPQH